MITAWRNFKRKRQIQHQLATELDDLQKRFPGYDWKPFHELRKFFWDKEMSWHYEQAFLYRMACDAPVDATVVEIGSWIGHSTSILGIGLKGKSARCYAIDPFTGMSPTPGEDTYYQNTLRKVSSTMTQRGLFDFHINHFGLQERVVAIAADSEKAVGLLPLQKESVDLLFVDGAHETESVRKDIELYLPFVKTGGVIAFHDFFSTCGVPVAVWEAIQQQRFSDLVGVNHSLIAFRKS